MSSKKYQTSIEKKGDNWSAKILRRLSKTKTHTSKQRDDFTSEADAQAWADSELSEFVNRQKQANIRQGEQRKENQAIKQNRSARRAEKTKATKHAEKEITEPPEKTDAHPDV